MIYTQVVDNRRLIKGFFGHNYVLIFLLKYVPRSSEYCIETLTKVASMASDDLGTYFSRKINT